MAIDLSVLCGDIDRSTAAAFRDGLYQSIDRAEAPIVEIDLAGVTFIDSAGYQAVAEANRYAVRSDHLQVIRNLRGPCTKLIRLCDQGNEIHLETPEALT